VAEYRREALKRIPATSSTTCHISKNNLRIPNTPAGKRFMPTAISRLSTRYRWIDINYIILINQILLTKKPFLPEQQLPKQLLSHYRHCNVQKPFQDVKPITDHPDRLGSNKGLFLQPVQALRGYQGILSIKVADNSSFFMQHPDNLSCLRNFQL
jgi:hypothetical protein